MDDFWKKFEKCQQLSRSYFKDSVKLGYTTTKFTLTIESSLYTFQNLTKAFIAQSYTTDHEFLAISRFPDWLISSRVQVFTILITTKLWWIQILSCDRGYLGAVEIVYVPQHQLCLIRRRLQYYSGHWCWSMNN